LPQYTYKKLIIFIISCFSVFYISGAEVSPLPNIRNKFGQNRLSPIFAATVEPFQVDLLGISEGLSDNNIYDIIQDSRGYLWFATKNGLCRYDGYRFVVYKSEPGNTSSLPDNWITTIMEDSEGLLWIGTESGGVSIFDRYKGTFTNINSSGEYDYSLTDDNVWGLMEAADGKIWISTFNGGINIYDKITKKVTHFSDEEDNGLYSENIWPMLRDSQGNIWIGSDGDGIFRLDQEENFFYQYSKGFDEFSQSSDLIQTIFEDSRGNIWVGTDAGLNLYDQENDEFILISLNQQNIDYDIDYLSIRSIEETSNGDLWLGTSGDGLFIFNHYTKKVTQVPAAIDGGPISNENINKIFCDESGIIWIATKNGLNKYTETILETARVSTDFNYENVNDIKSFFTDNFGNLWIGTRAGLFIYDKERSLYYRVFNECVFHFIIIDKFVYIATNSGLVIFDLSTIQFKHLSYDQGLSNSNVTIIHPYIGNKLLVGTFTGLDIFDTQTESFNNLPFIDSEVSDIYQRKDGSYIIATNGDGIYLLNSDLTESLNYDASFLTDGFIRGIAEDNEGTIWVGSYNSGLIAIKPDFSSITIFGENEGLPNNIVMGLVTDKTGNIWISTKTGLARLLIQTKTIARYSIEDGIQGYEFNRGASYISKEGIIYFGGRNGYNLITPDKLPSETSNNLLVITGFQRFGKHETLPISLSRNNRLNLTYRDTYFAIEVAMLDYVNSSNNRYSFKLEGIHKEWVDLGTNRLISFNNLVPGDYTLRIRSADHTGIWNEGISIKLSIRPPFWKQWWMIVFYILILSFGMLGIIKYQSYNQQKEISNQQIILDQLKKIDKMKDEFLANTSHELKTPLNGIIGIADSLIDGAAGELTDVLKINISMIAASSRRLFNLVNGILDFSKLKNRDLKITKKPVDIKRIIEMVITISNHLIKNKELTINNNTPENLPLIYADEDRIQQIMHNLIDNAVKFTEQGSITINAEVVGDYIEISIIDTGIGIPEDKLESIFNVFDQVDNSQVRIYGGTGLGLSITRDLIQLNGGIIKVKSKLGEGSLFSFTVPVCTQPQIDTFKNSLTVDDQEEAPILKENYYYSDAFIQDFKSHILKSNQLVHDTINILVVDDEPINIQVLLNQLSGLDYSIFTAMSGEDALKIIEENNGDFDLVILDIMMPRISGIEVCMKIREKYSMFDMPVLMLTAKNLPSNVSVGFEAGANDYLTKPFDKIELLSRVSTLLTLSQAVNNAISNAKKLETEKQMRSFAETITELTNALTETLELNLVMKNFLLNLRSVVTFDKGVVFLMENNGLAVGSIYSENGDESIDENTTQFINENIIHGMILINNKKEIISDFKTNYESLLGIPVMFRDNITAVILLESLAQNSFGDNEIGMLFSFAAQAGIAFENAKLFGEVKRLATIDGLTQLYNRRYFFELAEREFQRSKRYNRPLSVIMMDIDHFGNFNNTYGHATGDAVLQLVAKKCTNVIRETDVIGRYGGEEFIIMLPETEIDVAISVANRLQKGIEEEKLETKEYGNLSVTISLGVSKLDDKTNDLSYFLKTADDSLYEAKRSGRNCVKVYNNF